MTVYTYSRLPAFNPNTSPVSVAKSASGSVYDLGDTGFLTPLNITMISSGIVTTTLISDANGMFPDFSSDRYQLVFKSGTITFLLNTTDRYTGNDAPLYAYADTNLSTAKGYTDAQVAADRMRLTSTEGANTQQDGRLSLLENAAGFTAPPLGFEDSVVKALVDNAASDTRKSLDAGFVVKGSPSINPKDFGAEGDGTTDDTSAFTALELKYTGRDVDLAGLTYKVTVIPIGNHYFNGSWGINGGSSRGRYQGASLTGAGRIAFGDGALASLPVAYSTGSDGTALAAGYNAMGKMVEVQKSIAIGADTQSQGTKSRDNIAIGESSLRSVQSGTASYSQTDRTGTRNIGIGGNAGYFTTNGYGHTMIGRNAGQCIIGGTGLVAVGSNANGGYATIGLSGVIENGAAWGTGANTVRTVAIGNTAANANTASNIVAVGGEALLNNKKSDNNTAIGARALVNLDSGTGYAGGLYVPLSFTGTYSQSGSVLTMNIVGHGLAVGDVAYIRLLDGGSQTFASDIAQAPVASVVSANQFTITHPIPNTATGNASLSGKETAAQQPTNGGNVAVGTSAGNALTTGTNNALIGTAALNVATTATQTVAVGEQSMQSVPSSTNSVAIGFYSLGSMTGAASQATAVGASALRNASDGTALTSAWANISGVGYDSRVSAANQVQLGNSLTTTYVYGTVQNRSDARDKADVRDTLLGLEFIEKLRPVDYRWDMRDDYAELDDDGNMVVREKDGSKKRARYHHGFIAQEVQQIVKDTGVDFGGLQDHSINGGSDVLSIGYDEVIAPLVKAVQELTARVKELESQSR